jgi:preprotein translocase subunit SecD
VLRKRIDEFGVAEPVIQKVGNERIVVELAGIDDPVRAKSIVQRTAFLEFRITDETGALEKSLPAMDRALRRLGIRGADTASRPSAVEQLLGGGDSATRAPAKDSAGAAARTADSAAAGDTAAVIGGVLSGLIQPGAAAGGGAPGEYMVPETAFPRVDSLLSIPEVARQLPRGVALRWAAAPTSVGVQSYRFLYALDDKPIITGRNLVDATAQIDPLCGRSSPSSSIARADGSSATRRRASATTWPSSSTAGCRPASVIRARISRNGQITLSGRTLQEAQDLALTLKAVRSHPAPDRGRQQWEPTLERGRVRSESSPASSAPCS